MIIREFYLADKREPNKQFNLNIPNSAYLMNPSGLGYELDASYSRVGHHFVANYIRDKQMPINGKIVNVASDPYVGIQPFIDFIRNLKEPVLIYKTTAGFYFRDIDITAFGKTEMEKRSLICPITFIPKSLWYQTITGESLLREPEQLSSGIKEYTYEYPYIYGIGDRKFINVFNDGSVEAQFRIRFRGEIADPEITVVQDGVELNHVFIPANVGENEVLYYSTVDGELACYIEGITRVNLIGRLPIGEGNANFFGLPVGESELIISAGGNIADKVEIEIEKYYRVV